MRLLKVHSLAFEEFANERTTPRYGILSHRWLSEEVTFQDMVSGNASSKGGFSKVREFCNLCALDGLSHAWMDTCCIDKSSSAELTEAINSMYLWYKNATKCYAFLWDVNAEGASKSLSDLESEWFLRGWTLQELLAPTLVEFYDCTWEPFGTKNQLAVAISAITKIPLNVLLGEDPREYSIAQRMSWASNRTTTRVEDQAYSLMGLFDVNMPMLYGEGEKAFQRLQEEIIKHSGDQSIFAWPGILNDYWKAEMYDVVYQQQGGLLATSPSAFAHCGNIQWEEPLEPRQPFSLTNMGLSIELLLRPCSIDTYEAKLDCCLMNAEGLDKSMPISIYLRQTDQDGQYVREVFDSSSTQIWRDSPLEHRKVRVNVSQARHMPGNRLCRPSLRFSESPIFEGLSNGQPSVTVVSYGRFIPKTRIVSIPTGIYGTVALLAMQGGRKDSQNALLKLGFDFDFNPLIYIELDATKQPSLPNMHASSEWLSTVSWNTGVWNTQLSRYVASEETLGEAGTGWAFRSHRSHGLLVCLSSLNVIIYFEKRDLVHERYWTVDIQRANADEHHLLSWDNNSMRKPAVPPSIIFDRPLEHLEPKDLCPICSSFLGMPVSTVCGHTFCQACVQWVDISVSSCALAQVPLDYNEFPGTDSRRNDKLIMCPLCTTPCIIYGDIDRQRGLQIKYPARYASLAHIKPGSSIRGDSSKSLVLQTLTLLVGNTHRIADDRFATDLLDEKVNKNKHDWTFFVRPSQYDMIEEVNIHLHRTFNNPDILLRHPPFEVRRWGWGYFTIFVDVVLKPGYTFLNDESGHTLDNRGLSCLTLKWELVFQGNGGQGRLRVKVQRQKSNLTKEDDQLLKRFDRIRSFQAGWASYRAAQHPTIAITPRDNEGHNTSNTDQNMADA